MKNLLLSAIFLGSVFTASAQSGGFSLSPLGAGPGDAITITIDPNVVCNDGTAGLGSATLVRLHSGYGINGDPTVTANNWQGVVGAGNSATDSPDDVVKFTQNINGTWSKTITPTSYYTVASGDVITHLCIVLNGGPDATHWDLRGKYLDPTSAVCGDLFVPLPVAAPFGVTATKRAINNTFSIHPATPNPAVSETAVRVTLKQSGNVAVSIKNLLGQTVATLSNGFETAGEKTYTWNIGAAKPGIYFYTVESAGFTASAKINVVR
jgi:hypothetical protein